MKRSICCILVFSLIIFLSGCIPSNAEESIQFYYLRSKYAYGSVDSVIAVEVRDLPENNNINELLIQYLKGPLDSSLESPFPVDTMLIQLNSNGTIIHITLSDHIGKLTGVPLSLACACLAKTAMELTGAKTVQISADTLALNGKDFITVEIDDILLMDDSTVVTVPFTE